MEYTSSFAISQTLRDDAPLEFCDWCNESYVPPALVGYFDSVEQLDSNVVDELIAAVGKITDDKKRLLKLQLWDAMDIYAKMRKPELKKELELLIVELNELYLDNPCASVKIESKEKRRKWLTKKINSLDTLASRVASCCSFFVMGVWQNKITGKQLKKIVRAKTCKNRLCPNCNARKAFNTSWLTLAQVVSMVDNGFATCGIAGKKKKIEFKKGVATSFLTLTVENPKLADVNATFKKMRKALSVMFSNSTNSKKSALRNDWIRKNILGALCCLEWFGDKTPQGEAHLHFHILLVHDGALPYSKNKNYVETIFRRAWATALGRDGEWFSVEWHATKSYERALKETAKNGVYVELEKFQNVPDKNLKALFAMVLEVAKYAVTQAALEKISSNNIALLYGQTEYCRQVEKFGVFRGFEFPDGETKEKIWERVFEDYENLDDSNLWALKAYVKFYWSYFANKYKAEFVDDFHATLKPAPELELPDAPEKLPAEESFDVPLG